MRCFTSYGRGTLTILIEYIVIQNSERQKYQDKDGIIMNKKDSLEFLQNCADKIVNASEKDIKMFQIQYDIHCTKPLTSSEFEFVPPTEKQM